MLSIMSRYACPTPSRKPHPLWGGLTARIMCGCGRARRARLRGLRGLRCQRCAQTRTTRRFAARATGCRQCIADRCGYSTRVWPCPPPGAPAPVWRLRCAWPTGAWSPARRISVIVLGAMGYGGYAGKRAAARGIVRGRLAPPSSYISISTYLLTADQRGDGMYPPTATHSGARIAQFCARAVSYQAYHRADRPSRALRAAHAGTAARYAHLPLARHLEAHQSSDQKLSR